MGRNSIFNRSLSGLLAIACLLPAVPSIPAAAGITSGNPVPEILYSDSGAVVENPITDTDLDNFLISLKYGATEEDFGDTLFLRDACVSIPVTVSIEYTGEDSYHAGDLSFTLQDIEGLTRRNKDGLPEADAVTTEISAQRYGSETGTGDWCYYSEEMENHSGSYQFLNQFEVNGHFSSSIEMVWNITNVSSARSGFTQTITSTLSVKDLGDIICRPLYFTYHTTPTVFTMKPFKWEILTSQTEESDQEGSLYGYSPDEYEIIRVFLDFDQEIYFRSFGHSTDPDESYAEVNVTSPEGISVMNPDGSFNTPQRIRTPLSADPFLESLYPESGSIITSGWQEYVVFVPKALYPEGTPIDITAALSGRYDDELEPFITSTTQTIQIPVSADTDPDLPKPPAEEEPLPADTSPTETEAPETTAVTAVKRWEDENNQDGIRPDFVEVQLYADGTKQGEPARLDAENEWNMTWGGLPKYVQGTPVSYSVEEINVPEGYTPSVAGDAENGFTITNTHETDKSSIHGSIVWDDGNNTDALRPDFVIVNLIADGERVGSATASAETGWTFGFEDIDRNRNGRQILYTVATDEIKGYEQSVTDFVIVNAHVPETTAVNGTIFWDDENNQDAIRPEKVTVRLLAGGKEKDSIDVTKQEEWKFCFDELPAMQDGGPVEYSVSTDEIEGYETTVSGYDITRLHHPDRILIEGAAEWEDNDDQDGIRPGKITLRLFADNTEIDSREVSAEDGWKYSFGEQDARKDGETIRYTLTEDAVEGYDAQYDGFSVINRHEPETVTISGVSLWEDANDYDHIRPVTVTIRLREDGQESSVTEVSAATAWKYSFAGLPKYKGGTAIRYSIDEYEIDGYTSMENGTAFINIHHVDLPGKVLPDTVTVSGRKIWNDSDNKDRIRPSSITIRLLADGKEAGTKTVTAKDGWEYSFTGLPKASGGRAITYTIDEDKVNGYTKTVNGYNVTNTHQVSRSTSPSSAGIAGTASGSGSMKTSPPPTGDAFPVMKMTVFLLLSALIMALSVRKKKRRI